MTQNSDNSSPKGDRIAKVLARAAVASRREAERMIEAGRVSVDGKVLTSPALNIVGNERILVDGKPIAEAEPARIWMYHKPTGFVTTHKDEKGRKTIFDDLPDDMPRHVMTIGRLDLNSEGLLLLTNDGEVKRKLELPSTGWVRKYRVRVNGRPTEERFAPLREGITVDGEKFAPMMLTLDRQQGANAWVTVSLREGKNREIRRAMAAIDLSVNRLIRVSYGPFQLGDLKPGQVDELRRKVVRDQLGLDGAIPPEERKAPTRRRKSPAGKPGAEQRIPETPWGDPSVSGRKRPGGRGKPSGGVADRGKGKSDWTPGAKFGTKTSGTPSGKPGGKPTGKPSGKPFHKTGHKSGGKRGPNR